MIKQDLQKSLIRFLKARAEGQRGKYRGQRCQNSVVGKCGGGCGCSHEAFDKIRENILGNYKEIKDVERAQ